MNDVLATVFIGLATFVVFTAGLSIGIDVAQSPQKVINQFDKPVCVEKTVGKDKIKKCYELKEVK